MLTRLILVIISQYTNIIQMHKCCTPETNMLHVSYTSVIKNKQKQKETMLTSGGGYWLGKCTRKPSV